jgi:hypothetical protein
MVTIALVQRVDLAVIFFEKSDCEIEQVNHNHL